MIQEFHIVGIPKAQGRPKFARIGNHVHAYDPKDSRQYKDNVSAQIVAQGPKYVDEGPILLAVWFRLPRPKSLSKNITAHTKKPDLDNLLKGIKDAMKGIVWRDDSQVVEITAIKRYEREGIPPGVTIRVEDL